MGYTRREVIRGVAGATGALLARTSALAAFDSGPAVVSNAPVTAQFTWIASVPPLTNGARQLDLWIPLPSDSAYQKIFGLNVIAPFPHVINTDDRFGNRMAYLRVDAHDTPLVATVEFVVVRQPVRPLDSGRAGEAHSGVASSLVLKADSFVPVGGKFKRLADEATAGGNNCMDYMHALFENVVDTMQYDYKHESPEYGRGDVAFVCDYKKGNCSDLHSYLISLARSLKVPAYLEYGFPVTGVPVSNPLTSRGAIGGYHCWVWFQDEKHGWLPLDAADARRWADAGKPEVTEFLFGNLVTERSTVAVSRGRDIVLNPRQQADPLNYFIYPYAEADGRPVDVAWKVNYALPVAPAAR